MPKPKREQRKALTISVRNGFRLEVDTETSRRMAAMPQKDTKPELIVRQILHRLGVRYRLSNRDLPGSPDVANRSRRWVIFVHGCFWHQHPGCCQRTPIRNRDYWLAKFERNLERDRENAEDLREQGFEVITVWECETRAAEETLAARLHAALCDR
jgi:DNA mismatch endonuclease (patch repair protein)